VQLAASSVLQAIGKSSSSNARSIVDMGAADLLLLQLDSGCQEIMEAAVRTINVLVLSDHDLAAVLCPNSTLSIMVGLLQLPSSSPGLQKSILSSISAVCAFGATQATAAAQVLVSQPVIEFRICLQYHCQYQYC
jgi:hypothetical protein